MTSNDAGSVRNRPAAGPRRATGRRRDVGRRRDAVRRRDAGQAVAEYVGVLGLILGIVAIVLVGATPVGAQVSEQLICAVSPIIKEDGLEYCGEATNGPGGGEQGRDEQDSDDYSPPSGDCEQDVAFDWVEVDADWTSSVVQIGCEWQPVSFRCLFGSLPTGWLDRAEGDRIYRQDEIVEFVDCVTDGRGGPSEDPNDEQCANAVPSSHAPDPDAPPKVQVGCKELPVPKGCEKEWAAYEDAVSEKERAGASGWLANCVAETYKHMEPPCVVSSTGHVDSSNISFLFFRWGESNGTLIEKLGDGRIRIHVLRGVEFGAGISGDEVGGSPVSFGIAGITGYSKDKTYEFTSMEKAQEWIDWYQAYNLTEEFVFSGAGRNCNRPQMSYCPPPPEHMPDVGDMQELAQNEPEHHELAEAEADTQKVKFTGGLTFSGEAGPVNFAGSVEGGYTGEIKVEERLWSDGTQTATYTSSDIGGFLIGASLGGKQPFTKDKKGKTETGAGGSASGSGGMTWKGTTSTTVAWDKKGDPALLIISMDEQVMETLYKAGVDLEATLPYGFTVGLGMSGSQEEGTESKRQLIIDFKQYPHLVDELGPAIDELFPRDDEGRLIKQDVEINGNDHPGGTLYDAAEEYANVRELSYDAEKVTEGGSTGITWQGLDLFKVDWTSVEEEKTLVESSFEVTDVDGNKQTASPSPQCRAKDFVPKDDYYSDDFSDPPTGANDSDHDLGAEYYSNDTPKYTDGTYPGTGYDGDVPGDRDDLIHSLLDEYSKEFEDKNILVVKDFGNFSFRGASGWEHLATVDGMDVIALDEGTVKNKGDGGWINWGFTGRYDYDSDNLTVRFERK